MNYKFNVFPSFRGEDVRQTFLCHLRKQFNHNGITTFDDQGIERSEKIAPSLIQTIRESRISIVILSVNYACSSWCLNELVEILECKKAMGQIVMTIFHGVDPSHVRKQTGEFGSAFKKTCSRSTDEEKEKWSKALTDVSNILGEHQWDNEAKMIEKIAKDVSDKLNATPSMDFDGMVGLGSHLREMVSLLDLDYDGVKIVAITGPAGIGKTTIARALQSQLSYRFQLTCFVDNLRGSYHSGLDEYGLKLRLQEQLLSKILNQKRHEDFSFRCNVECLDLSYKDIEKIPDCIKTLYRLQYLYLSCCRRLASLPELPCSLVYLKAEDCESLERVNGPLDSPHAELDFTNCFNLGEEARRVIIVRSIFMGNAPLPGREVPAEFDLQGRGNSLTISNSFFSMFSQFKVCVVISPNQEIKTHSYSSNLVCRINGVDVKIPTGDVSKCRGEHLFIFHSPLLYIDPSEADREMTLEFSSEFQDFNVIGCGVKICIPPRITGRHLVFESDNEFEPSEADGSNNGGSGDEDGGNNHWDTHESDEASDDDNTADGRFEYESNEASDEEDDGEGYKSES